MPNLRQYLLKNHGISFYSRAYLVGWWIGRQNNFDALNHFYPTTKNFQRWEAVIRDRGVEHGLQYARDVVNFLEDEDNV